MTKADTHLFESGEHGLSAQLLARGHEIRVVDREGNGYAPNQWPGSNTFRSGDQEGLLISDNRTEDYQTADKQG